MLIHLTRAVSLILLVMFCATAAGAQGRYRKIQGVLTPEQEERIEVLRSLGYLLGHSVERAEVGVTVWDSTLAQDGLNLYTSGHGQEAILMDLRGTVIHRWSFSFPRLWPRFRVKAGDTMGVDYFFRAALAGNGDLFLMYQGAGIIRVDKDSNLLWASQCKAHHDMVVGDGGEVYVLSRDIVLWDGRPVRDDFVVVLDPEGNEARRVSLLRAFEDSRQWSALLDVWKWNPNGDLFHANSIEPLGGGRFLLSLRHVDALVVLNLETEVIEWVGMGEFTGQHDARMVDGGDVLIFDNQYNWNHPGNGESRVLQLTFPGLEVVWRYGAGPEFYSESAGAAQRLPNGNTLISESDRGRAFEVTPAGEIVWEFCSPHRRGRDEVATLFRLQRVWPQQRFWSGGDGKNEEGD